jgi:dTDP-4-amino-4,6-dideoxygalactose transaminase
VTKLVAYHLLTDPRVYGYTRALYLWLGRRQPFPGATTEAERRGLPRDDLQQRLSNAQAVLGLRQLRRLAANLEHRRSIAAKCERELSRHGFDSLLPPPKADPALIRYPIRVSDRDRAIRAAAPHVVLGTWFTNVLEESVSPAVGDYRQGSCPRAEEAVEQLVNLPTHPRITRRNVEVIIEALAAAEDAAPTSDDDVPT